MTMITYFKDSFSYVAFDFKGAQILTVQLIHVTSSGVNDVKHSFTRVKHGVSNFKEFQID